MNDLEHNQNDNLPEESQPEDEFSLEGKGWDILVGGRENAENLGGEDPFGLAGLPEEEPQPEPEAPIMGALDDAAPVAAITPQEESSAPRERLVIEMNALADDAFDQKSEEIEAMSVSEEPVGELPEPVLPVDEGEAAPEVLPVDQGEAAPDFLPVDTGEAAPDEIPGRVIVPAAEEDLLALDEPEPFGVVDESMDNDTMTLDDLLSADSREASGEPHAVSDEAPALPEVPDWATISGTANGEPAKSPAMEAPNGGDSGEVIETEETSATATTIAAPATLMPPPVVQAAAHQLLQRSAITDPFQSSRSHEHDTYTEDTFETDAPANTALRNMLVTPQRITDLWEEIDEVYDMVVNDVRGHFETTEAAIADLQKAKMLLLASEDNYDNAQQLLMHVKARLRLEQKVRAWTRTRGTWLALYLIAWLFLITLLSFMTNRVSAVMDLFVPSWMVSMYLPALFGGMGGVIGALWVLIKHAAQKRDFDPIHTTWYVTNPFMGLALGVIAYLIVWGGGNVLTSVASPGATTFTEAGETSIALYLICLIVGFNQNLLWRLLDKFIKSITPAEDEEEITTTGATGTE